MEHICQLVQRRIMAPITTSVLCGFSKGLSRRTLTSLSRLVALQSLGYFQNAIGLHKKEETTPAAPAQGLAISLPPTQPMRTRTNS